MPLVTRTPSSSWTRGFIMLREQFGHFLVRLGTAVAVELPHVPHVANHVEVQVRGDDRILVARAFGNNLAAWIGEITRSVKLPETPRLLGSDAVDRADIVDVGHGGSRLFQLPEVFA